MMGMIDIHFALSHKNIAFANTSNQMMVLQRLKPSGFRKGKPVFSHDSRFTTHDSPLTTHTSTSLSTSYSLLTA